MKLILHWSQKLHWKCFWTFFVEVIRPTKRFCWRISIEEPNFCKNFRIFKKKKNLKWCHQKSVQCNFCDQWSISLILKSFYQIPLPLSNPGYINGFCKYLWAILSYFIWGLAFFFMVAILEVAFLEVAVLEIAVLEGSCFKG